MWGTQGWNQWALQPSMFQNVPHEEIDWAALAKQWIQMQHVPAAADGASPVPVSVHPAAPPPPPPPPPPAVEPEEFQNDIPPPPFTKPPLLEDPYNRISPPDVSRSPLPVSETDPSYQVRQSDGTYWSNQEWELSAAHDIDERMWSGPSIEPLASGQMSKETFDYGHLPDNPPLQMHTVDYNHVSDQFGFNQVYTPENQYDVYWSQVGTAVPTAVPAPTFLKKDRLGGSVQAEEDISHIDAAKRKQLPAWIREGLEKMEQERLKRLEKERAEKEKTEKLKMKKKNDASATKGLNLLQSGEYDKSPPTMPLKSKFDSDSEVEDDEAEEPSIPAEEAPPSPVEDLRTEEEKHQELMLKVRRMLTEILLDVTNTEMLSIAKEVYQKARLKAPARQLAVSSALPSVATGLRGLASYGSHSEESESEDEDADDNTDSDEELYRKIREKRKNFAIKEKKIIAELDREEAENREKKLAKAKAEAQVSEHTGEKIVTQVVSVKSNSDNEEVTVPIGTSSISVQHKGNTLFAGAAAFIPFLTDDQSSSPPEELKSESSALPEVESFIGDDLTENNGDDQKHIPEESEEQPEKIENSSVINVSDSEMNNSSKSDDDDEQDAENHSEENSASQVKEKPLLKSYLDEADKESNRKVKEGLDSEKSKSKKKRSRSKGSDSSVHKNSGTKKSKHGHRRSSKSSHRKKQESSSASSSSSATSSSSSSTSSSSYRSTSVSKERRKSHRSSGHQSDVRRSNSYERHRKSKRNHSRDKKKSRSRSRSYSNHGHSRSTSRSSYHNSNKIKHRDSYTSDSRSSKLERYPSRSGSKSPDTYRKVKKDYKRKRSRSPSRTPKKYKKRSWSVSSESETSSKTFSTRRRHR